MTPTFFCISDTSNSLSVLSKNFRKIYRLENFRTNVLKCICNTKNKKMAIIYYKKESACTLTLMHNYVKLNSSSGTLFLLVLILRKFLLIHVGNSRIPTNVFFFFFSLNRTLEISVYLTCVLTTTTCGKQPSLCRQDEFEKTFTIVEELIESSVKR